VKPHPEPLRVLLLALDGFPHRMVSAALTPRLAALAADGGQAPDGGRSPLPSTTYPGFASLLTGASIDAHRVRTTFSKEGAVPGWAGERDVAVPTLLDACRAAGLGAAAVMGDQKLVSVLRTGDPAAPWPGGGTPPATAARDDFGYLVNDAVWPAMVTAVRDPAHRFLFCHLNEADTVGHLHGPDSPEATACYRATDRVVERILEVMRTSWHRWVVIVVSDHDMERRAADVGVDPMTLPGIAEIADDWIGDGGCAWLRLRECVGVAEVDRVLRVQPEITGWQLFGDRVLLMGHAGVAWHAGAVPLLGIHGGPSVRHTVAIVGGGHEAVRPLASAIAERPPELRDWAPTIARLLGVDLPHADGRDLLAERS
jgi:arylsulfatase A-like enzyme